MLLWTQFSTSKKFIISKSIVFNSHFGHNFVIILDCTISDFFNNYLLFDHVFRKGAKNTAEDNSTRQSQNDMAAKIS